MDKQEIEVLNRLDKEGNPAGGTVRGMGLDIIWQSGPLGRGPDRKAPNGTFVETVVRAAMSRLNFYQSSKFKCHENERATAKLDEALVWLSERTKAREKREVEGVNVV